MSGGGADDGDGQVKFKFWIFEGTRLLPILNKCEQGGRGGPNFVIT